MAVYKINIKPLIRKESLLFSKETPKGELEVRKFKDGTYHVFVNNKEHAWFDEDDLTSLKYYLKYKKDIPEDEIVLESLKEELKTYYVSYKESEGKFKGKYVDLPIKANSKEEAEEKFLKDYPDIKSHDYKVVAPEESLEEDTVQKANGKWTNRGDDGTEHGEFDTKAEADAQRKAMFASGYKGESITESFKDTNLYRDLVAKVSNAIRLCGSEEESVGLDEDNTIVFKLKYGIAKHQINDLYDMLEDISSHSPIKEFQINTLPWTGDTYVLIAPDVDFSDESLDEKLNLDKEGKALKRAIKNIIVDSDDELREFVSAIVEEVISERKGLEESVDNPEEFNVGDRVAFVGRPVEDKGTIVTGVGDVIQKDGRTYKVKVLDDRINTKKGQIITIDGMSLYNKSYFD